MVRLNVNPNRMVLADLQTRIVSAKQGHALLKEKQDAMIRQFMGVYEKASVLRKQVDDALGHIQNDYMIATLERSEAQLNDTLSQGHAPLIVKRKHEEFMGIVVPVFELQPLLKSANDGGIIRSHARIDALQENVQFVQENIVAVARLENVCQKIAKEIKATRRRVNALEFKTIPDLEETIAYIKLRIDDQVRSQQTRILKVMKEG